MVWNSWEEPARLWLTLLALDENSWEQELKVIVEEGIKLVRSEITSRYLINEVENVARSLGYAVIQLAHGMWDGEKQAAISLLVLRVADKD